ncbi:flagellar basal body L-ring protein FlgH [Rubripirellula reticaptiva]|uniref:Flagellar L-ring protein n=1 Tax=Rubripirellula reticaptiva TaxID=2528013 RepID=A0A5C6EKC8_9BACT|nr:flagellar basal body L-ring protein FlgH [Rubripirellula reticaptiva]TWU48071.1 Flagellar L-ring protein precursor [Rubripirellula reticaptiva]
MKNQNSRKRILVAWACAATIALFALMANVNAQNSSLMYAPMPAMAPRATPGQSVAEQSITRQTVPPNLMPAPTASGDGQMALDRPAVLIDRASWTYQPASPMRTFQKNDVVTIRVDEITRVLADGSANQRKQTLYEAILTDWIKLTNGQLRTDPQPSGDPAIAAESNTNYRAQSSIQSRESMTFNIAATVVDIRANGSLVLEARKSIRINDNLWETSLTGICRAQDIAPDNVVLSKDLIDLEILKEDQGHLRDGYKRGWLARWIDRFKPF